MKITRDSRIEQTDQCILAEVDEDLVLLSLTDGRFYSLKETGRRTWELLEQNPVVNDLVKALMAEFDVDDATCTEDVIALLGDLAEREFVSVST